MPGLCSRQVGLAGVRGEAKESRWESERKVVAARGIRLPRRERRTVSSRQEISRRQRQKAVPAIPLGRHAMAQGQAGGPENSVSTPGAARGASHDDSLFL